MDELAKFCLRRDDVILTKDSETADDIGVPALVEYEAPDLICEYHLSIVRPHRGVATGPFLFWAAKSRPLQVQFELEAQGVTRFGVSVGAMGGVMVPTPPRPEQHAIAAFLDNQTAKIDTLIQKQRRVIEVLEEKRQTFIAHAVTKGLDPNVVMKPSGIDWLGDVPSDWQVKRFKEVLYEIDDRSEEGSEELLSVSHITGVTPRSEKTVYMFEAETKEGYKRCEPGDLVVNTMWAWMGALGVSPCRGIVSPSYNVYRTRKKTVLHPRFLDLLCRIPPLVAFIKCVSTGVWTSRLRLYPETLFDIRFALPPLTEQKAIVAMVERKSALARRTSAAATAAISLLEEHRTSLITAAVTGTIDVRERSATVRQPDRAHFRVLVTAEITHRHQARQRFGRVKLQKLLYLAEAHAGIHELQGNYYREAAGPLDSGMIADAERGMIASEFFNSNPQSGTGNGVSYTPLAKAGRHTTELTVLLGSRMAALTHMIDLLRDLDTRSSEIIATLYAIWNDALLDGVNLGDDQIVQKFLNEWHPKKRQKFKEAEVRHWLYWMKRNTVVPSGTGPRTISTVPRDMFS